MLHEFGEQSQFIVITHNKKTVAGARTLLGVTMQENGVSQVVAVRIDGDGISPDEPAREVEPEPALELEESDMKRLGPGVPSGVVVLVLILARLRRDFCCAGDALATGTRIGTEALHGPRRSRLPGGCVPVFRRRGRDQYAATPSDPIRLVDPARATGSRSGWNRLKMDTA